jgi:hypothetical protein
MEFRGFSRRARHLSRSMNELLVRFVGSTRRQALHRTLGLLLGLAIPLGLAGCGSTMTQRIEEKSGEFAALTPEEQAEVKAGVIKVGQSKDVVYMALGQPSVTEAGEGMETWVYRNYFPSETVAAGIPSPKGAALAGHHSSNLSALDASRLPSEGSGRGDMGIYEGQSSASRSPSVPVMPPSVTLRVYFLNGKVSDFQLER